MDDGTFFLDVKQPEREADEAHFLVPKYRIRETHLPLTSPTRGGRSVGIVRSLTKAQNLVFLSSTLCTPTEQI
jgi:hypothetical protein